jgi:hypothetical protein
MEQAKQDEAPFTEEELKWLEHVRAELQPVARRHGAQLFQITWIAGLVGETLGQMGMTIRRLAKWGFRRELEALSRQQMILLQNTNELCNRALRGIGKTPRDLKECKADIERTMALAQGGKQLQEGERISSGGIILDS